MAQSPSNTATPPPVLAAEPRHLEGLVTCHCLTFPDEAITRLGRTFLKAFFRYFMRRRAGVVLAAVEPGSDKVVGYVIAGVPGLRKRFLWTRALFLGPIVLWKALTDRTVRQRLREPVPRVEQGQRPAGPAGDGWPADEPAAAVTLQFLGVHPDCRRRGVATAVLSALRAHGRREGYRTLRVKTPNVNARAIAAYQSAGWTISGVGERYTYLWRSTRAVDAAEDKQ